MNKLYGLVLCGGESSRMGNDKSLLNYHGKPQRYHVYELLRSFCEETFISCNRKQSEYISPQYKVIIDNKKYAGNGPITALLSAFEQYPDASFLLVGCDYPFMEKKYLEELVKARIGLDDALFFCHPETKIEEPLVCIYENNARLKLQQCFLDKKYSLRAFLKEVNSCMIFPSSSDFLKSVDDPLSFEKAREMLFARLN